MKLHKHFLKRLSFTVEIVGEDMELSPINEFSTTMISNRMEVNLGEKKLSLLLDRSEHMPYLEAALDEIQEREDQEGRRFTEEPEILAVPERSLLVQDGITEKKVRVITFLAITHHQGEDYLATIRGSIPDDAMLTTAFIQSVFATLRGIETVNPPKMNLSL